MASTNPANQASNQASNDVPPTHVKFSQLVRDDTLLKPRLDDDVLVRDVRTVQEAYLKAVQEIHKDVSEAVGNIQDPARERPDGRAPRRSVGRV